MNKRVFFILVALLATWQSAFAYNFSAVAPSGQTLYYNISNGSAVVTYPHFYRDDDDYYYGYTMPTGDLFIPDSVTNDGTTYAVTAIGYSAFAYCDGLTTVSIPNTVTSIGRDAFLHCNGIITATISNSLSSIGNEAFMGCSGLTSISIPHSVTNIGSEAFSLCSGLTEVILKPTVAPTLGNDALPTTATIYIPCGSLASYQSLWGTSRTYLEEMLYTHTITSENETMGLVEVTEVPTCENNVSLGINAQPTEDHYFVGWSDGCTDNPRTLTLTQDTILKAMFEIITYTVTVINAYGGGTYTHGSTATLMALPQVNGQFAGWSDGETANPRSLVVVSDTTIEALFRAPDTVRIYDTVTVYDTVVNIVYDTTEYNHYYYDTTLVFDTMVYVNIDTLNHYYYDTTRVFDTMVFVNIDTLNHFYYDTTRVFDTMVFVNVDTLNHYYYDTTRVFDTMVFVNIDTLNHYYYQYDTTIVFDTMVFVNVDTLNHYYYQYDTTLVFDTMVFVNIDTLNHYYYQYDTTLVFDTMVFVNIDTLNHYYYQYDTTLVFDTMVFVNIDTLNHYYYQYDTTLVFDTIVFVNIDTLNHYYSDTTVVTHYIFDSTWVFDTIYIFDTVYIHDTIVVGIDNVETINAKIYQRNGQVVVEGAEGNTVTLYDVNGRVLATKQDNDMPLNFDVPATGTYMIKIGNAPARRVVVIR